METTCPSCGSVMQSTTPFCPQCGTRQPMTGGTVPPVPVSHQRPSVNWSSAAPRAAICGAVGGILTMASPPLLFALPLLLAGFVAVRLYAASSAKPALTAGVGARIGAVTGLFVFGMYALVVSAVAVGGRERFLAEARAQMQAQIAKSPPTPEARQVIEKLSTPEGILLLMLLGSVIFLFVFLLACTAGGAIAGARTKREPQSAV